MNCRKYYDYLFNKIPKWEADVLKDWFPEDDAWIGSVRCWNPEAAQIEVLESVRRLSEGLAYKRSNALPE